jgi:hypothetical protein
MVLWLRARYLGMNRGNLRAAEEGLTGTQVFQGPELSVVHGLKDRGYASVLYDVLPRAPFDYVSYSCYEILNTPDPGTALKEDLNLIHLATGSRRIVLGEVGYPRSAMGERLIPTTLSVVAEAIAWGVEQPILRRAAVPEHLVHHRQERSHRPRELILRFLDRRLQ